MQEYHQQWLVKHPSKTKEWLQEKIKEGFDIHHLDGNHFNNDPSNLLLIWGRDHAKLHGRIDSMLYHATKQKQNHGKKKRSRRKRE